MALWQYHYIFATQCRRSIKVYYVRLSVIGMRNFVFVIKAQFLLINDNSNNKNDINNKSFYIFIPL